jgi:hypothetical protein
VTIVTPSSAVLQVQASHADLQGTTELSHEGETNETNHEGDHEGFQIFHLEWERVELPFMVGVWILATTISKLGQF